MLYAKRKDIILPQSAPSGTGAQTLRFLIKQERRRLEAFTVRLGLTTNAAAMTGAAWAGYAGAVKEIRLVVNDGPAGGGQRNVVQISGPACLSYVRQLGLNIDRKTQIGYASAGFTGLSTSIELNFYVPIRHPSFQEPLGNVLAFPLSSTYSANDVYVEVDLYDISAGGAVFTTNGPSYTANATLLQTHLVEIPDSFPYIRSEWRTDTGFSTNATANVPYEFTSGGFLTGFLMQGFSAVIGNAVTRSTLLSSGGQYRIEYGREVLMKSDESFMQSLNDLSSIQVYPNDAASIGTGGVLQNRNFAGESFFDFLTDLPGVDAFSLASCPDLNTDALGGDKFRLVFNDLASSSRAVHFTYHKLLSSRESIIGVVKGFEKQGVTA